MRKALARVVVLPLAVACLLGFSLTSLAIHPSQTPSGSLEFTLRSEDRTAGRDPVRVVNFAVYAERDGKWDYAQPLWQITAVSTKGVAARSISYGVVPEGFTEAASAQELASGIVYQAVGIAPNAVGAVDFEL